MDKKKAIDPRILNPLPTGMGRFATLDRRQAVLESLRDKFDGPGVVQCAGFLRLETVFSSGGETTLRFPVIADQGNEFDTERRLDRNDSFTITDVGFFLGFTEAATAAEDQGADTLYAGPCLDATAGGASTAVFDAIHGGKLRVTCDSTVYLDDWDILRCREVGQAQMGLTQATGGDPFEASTWNEQTGMVAMLPSLTLSGAMKNNVEIDLPRLVVPEDPLYSLHAVLLLRGYLNQQGAEFRSEA